MNCYQSIFLFCHNAIPLLLVIKCSRLKRTYYININIVNVIRCIYIVRPVNRERVCAKRRRQNCLKNLLAERYANSGTPRIKLLQTAVSIRSLAFVEVTEHRGQSTFLREENSLFRAPRVVSSSRRSRPFAATQWRI